MDPITLAISFGMNTTSFQQMHWRLLVPPEDFQENSFRPRVLIHPFHVVRINKMFSYYGAGKCLIIAFLLTRADITMQTSNRDA